MKKKIIGILVCMLLIGTAVLTASGTVLIEKTSKSTNHEFIELTTEICGIPGLQSFSVKITKQDYHKLETLFDTIKSRFDTTSTRNGAEEIFEEAVIELNKIGLLPMGMNICQIKQLVIGGFLNSLHMRFQDTFRLNHLSNKSGNTNCLVIGKTDYTYFRPFPALVIDIPIFYTLLEYLYSISSPIASILLLPYAFRVMQPLKFGSQAYFGQRYKLTEQGNVTRDDSYSSSGWVWTIGSNGIQKWNDTFYGNLYCKYQKKIYEDVDVIWENWDPVGVIGFIGIKIGILSPDIDTFYIGFARKVNYSYYPPWS
ncbi:MAG: hypothetical protein KAU84_04945 [Thermoplasmatales archaeon]|nr:hypothetical protein [Thermoplasmatales archaeon]